MVLQKYKIKVPNIGFSIYSSLTIFTIINIDTCRLILMTTICNTLIRSQPISRTII